MQLLYYAITSCIDHSMSVYYVHLASNDVARLN